MDVATKEAIGNISLRNNGIAQSNKHCVLKFDSHQISCAKKKKKGSMCHYSNAKGTANSKTVPLKYMQE